MDNIYVEFAQAGEPKSDAATKAHVMAKCGRKWEAIEIQDRMKESSDFKLPNSSLHHYYPLQKVKQVENVLNLI